MEKTLPDRQSLWSALATVLRAAGVSLLLALTLSRTATGQQIAVTGTVASTGGAPIQGVTVGVTGSDTRVLTSANGRYLINAPANGVLTFVSFGRRPYTTSIAGRTRIDVTMSQISYL